MQNREATNIGFLADMAAIEAEIQVRRQADEAELDREFAEMMRDDSIHCRTCGAESSGSTIAGCHVQACDGCIARWVREQTGQSL